MRAVKFFALVFFGFFFPATALGGELIRTGIIKGSITNGGRPVADAVVSVEGVPSKYFESRISESGSRHAVMDQQDLTFHPRVLPILVGTTVNFPNHDKSWHNVFSYSEAKEFDLGLYPPGKSRSVTFDKPGVVRILCNVHPSIKAYVVVKNHPYFSSVDSRGNYRINSVPLGTYWIQVWHPELGSRRASIELVRDGEVLDVNFDLKK